MYYVHISVRYAFYIRYTNTEQYPQPFVLFFSYLSKEAMFADRKIFSQIIKYQNNNSVF